MSYRGLSNDIWLSKCKVLAALKNGYCLSEEYVNSKTKMLWECEHGHRWEAAYSNVKKGKWCPDCAGNKPYTIEHMQKIAEQHKGECLSPKYLGVKTHLLWKCSRGHEWKATPEKVLKNRWCPYCSQSFSENIVRCYFEQMTGLDFPKSRPSWLVNRYGHRLELDGFCKKLNIAFEHNGSQHYKLTTFSKTPLKLKRIKQNDVDKIQKCKNVGVDVLVIPQLFRETKIQDLKKIIKLFLDSKGINIVKTHIDISNLQTEDNIKFNKIKGIVESKGGVVISEKYLGSTIKMRFRCKNDHIWETLPYNILIGHWCKHCARKKK